MRKFLLCALAFTCCCISQSQTLFTYGPHAVTKAEFVRAFNKNPSVSGDRKAALKEYLDLYINFKLKVQAAYDAKLQNDPVQTAELNNFKLQIADNIINEEAQLSKLVQEAFDRSQKDIHLAQIYIDVAPGSDTTAAFRQIQSAYQQLQSGKDFKEVNAGFSSDVSSVSNGGDLGFVTVFTLPYLYENVAYSTAPGTYSKPFRSDIGYHIFKNLGERKPLGSRKVAQILITFPPNGTEAEKQFAAAKADSVYKLLKAGANFAEKARELSNDIASANDGGTLTEFGIGVYSPAFEEAAFGLQNVGDISAPVATTFGYHILQLIQTVPVGTDRTNVETLAMLQEKVQRDDRLNLAKKALVERQIKLTAYKPAFVSEKDLWRFTDSAIINKSVPLSLVSKQTVLFSFAKQKVKAEDWVNYVKATRTASVENGQKGYSELMKEYINQSATDYYRNHLEDFSAEYKQQVSEFKDANLLFGIMDANVWSKANTDTIGLKDYYTKNKGKYVWSPSADAIIVTCDSDSIAEAIQEKLKADPGNWNTIINSYGAHASADSGRFELGQLPVVDRTRFEDNLLTAPLKNEGDKTTTFNYIFKMYPAGETRGYEDAKGLIISDYQQVLEDRWIEQLKKKYPVKVNMTVFGTIR